jgi:hypothetical protein
MTKKTLNHHNNRNMPLTTTEIATIYRFSEHYNMELVRFIGDDPFYCFEEYKADEYFDAGIHIPFRVDLPNYDDPHIDTSIYGMLRVLCDEYEEPISLDEHLIELKELETVFNLLLEWDWDFEHATDSIYRIVVNLTGQQHTESGYVERQFIVKPVARTDAERKFITQLRTGPQPPYTDEYVLELCKMEIQSRTSA